MEEGRPSATAEGAALLRAAHQILDEPRVLDDPLALRILGAKRESMRRADAQPLEAHELRALRAFVVMRSRYAEDRLREAVGRGVRQYVLLGAGLDTFAYRNPHPDLRVFEVDHAATQAWKRERLRDAGIAMPSSVTFVAADFERQTLADVLGSTDLDRVRPTFFSWLGVTVYLSRHAVMETLRFVASATAAGSEIVFSFAVSPSPLAEHTAALGEPWRTFFDPPALAEELRRIGFGGVETLGPEEANRRYFANRADGLRVAGSGHLMAARV